jgi:hypothetical protein
VARLCALSIDLDAIGEYRRLHGLDDRPEGAQAVYDVALARAEAFARSEGLALTFFAVGCDLDRPESAERLAAAVRRGHLVENHSQGHRYDLTALSPDDIDGEVARAQERIASLTGRRPRGFRAPGYAVSDVLFDALERHGLAFDSSVFPSAPYYLAKAAARSWIGLSGRSSAARLDSPAVLLAPRDPYRPGRPWHRRGERSFVELPITVTRPGGLPFIGTALTLAGAVGARLLARLVVGRELVNLELHAIDFLDACDGLDDLVGHQPDVGLPVGLKQRAIGAALDVLRAAGYRFTSLAEAAEALSPER